MLTIKDVELNKPIIRCAAWCPFRQELPFKKYKCLLRNKELERFTFSYIYTKAIC